MNREEAESILAMLRSGERDRSDPFAEGMTRSEEEIRIGQGEMVPVERVRLRKVLVTEHVQMTVPRRKEVIQLETEPAPEGVVEDLGPVDER